MVNFLNFFFPKGMIGVDIGTSAIKLVEISRWGRGITLENYAEFEHSSIYKESSVAPGKSNNSLSVDLTAKIIREILKEAKIRTRRAVFAVPDFFTFCTSFEIPPMPEEEIPEAIRYNASQFITLPVSEVEIDWRIVSKNEQKNTSTEGEKSPLKIFIAAIPRQVVQEYKEVARLAGIELYAIEAEAFSVARALIKNNKKTICLIDMGAQSSVVNIIDNGHLRRSYSINFHGNNLNKAISAALAIAPNDAEKIKNKEGILSSLPGVVETLYPLINPLIAEIRTISSGFYQLEQKNVEEVYLTGGVANLPGLKEYFSEVLKKNVSVPNCFSDFLYKPILEETLKEMSPRFSIAAGAALAGLEA